jgi:pilus assembly protein Flp/PilA
MGTLNRVKSLPIGLKIWVDTILADASAQDLVEYALMAGFVAVTSGALMPGVSTNISKIFSTVGSVMTNAKNQGS